MLRTNDVIVRDANSSGSGAKMIRMISCGTVDALMQFLVVRATLLVLLSFQVAREAKVQRTNETVCRFIHF